MERCAIYELSLSVGAKEGSIGQALTYITALSLICGSFSETQFRHYSQQQNLQCEMGCESYCEVTQVTLLISFEHRVNSVAPFEGFPIMFYARAIIKDLLYTNSIAVQLYKSKQQLPPNILCENVIYIRVNQGSCLTQLKVFYTCLSVCYICPICKTDLKNSCMEMKSSHSN